MTSTGERTKIERAARAAESLMVPKYGGRPGIAVVGTTWGTIQPLEIAPGVATVGELEVIAQLESGLSVVDTRHVEHFEQAHIPGARRIPHEEIVDRIGELDPDSVTVLYCNGPQCTATPRAVRALLDAGYPGDKLRYYRGGIHDWMTLGLPIVGSRTGEDAG